MQVITNENDQKAILIPLDEYDSFVNDIKAGKDLASILNQIPRKAAYDMTPEEMKAHLMPTAKQLVKEALNEGLYSSIWLDIPNIKDHFLHKYADGTTELIQVDAKTGEEKVLQVYK